MTAGHAATETPHPLAITLMVAVAALVPMIVFGNRMALLVVAAAAVPATVWAVIRHPRAGWLLAVACLPITVAAPIATTSARLSVPLEVLAGILAPLLIFALLFQPQLSRRFLLHPLSVAVTFQLAWMTASTAFSSDPVVSAKALAVRVVYLAVFYIGGFLFLDRALPGRTGDPVRTTTTAVLLLAAPTALWALARHLPHGFARRESYEIAQPFFSNHTEYATVLVVWLCLAAGLRGDSSDRRRTPLSLLLILLGAAVFAAGARSAWIALLGAAVTLVAIRFKPDPWKIAGSAALILLAGGIAVQGLSERQVDRSFAPGKTAARTSTYDWVLTHDLLGGESSLERLNRWHSAARMLRDRPLFGFGPGTFEMTYGSYQQHQQLTRVSTFKGDRGGAHSEFMTVAAERGFGGILSLLAVVVLGLRSGVRAYRSATTARDSRWAAVWTAAFVALGVSSCFNSLLELDKTAPLFWLAAAVLAHLDLKTGRSGEHTAKDGQSLLRRPRPAEGA